MDHFEQCRISPSAPFSERLVNFWDTERAVIVSGKGGVLPTLPKTRTLQ